VPEGSIIFQDPPEGESLEPGSRVNVTESLGVRQVEVPETYGASLSEAQGSLENVGIYSTPVEVPGDEAAGTALETDPLAGTLVDPGSTVTLYYSAGPPEPTIVASPEPEPEPEPDASAEPEDENADNENVDPNSGNGVGNVPQNVQENVQDNENIPGGGKGGGGSSEGRGERGGNSGDGNNGGNNGNGRGGED